MTGSSERLLIAALAWGALSFGAVYPWAHWPLAVACAAIGWMIMALALTGSRSGVAPVVVSLVIGGIRRRLTTDADQRLTWWIRIGAIAGLAGIAAQSVVEFSLQMPGNTALFVLLLALAMHRPRSESQRSSSARVRPFSTHALAHRI